MTPELSRWLLFNLILAAIALGSGCGAYLILRFIENWALEGATILNWLGAFVTLVLVGAFMTPLLTLYEFVASILVGVAGSNFHLKSEGASRNWRQAFILMVFATLVSINLEISLITQSNFRSVRAPAALWFLDNVYFVLFLMAAPVAFTPFLMWAWKNSKLRPGIDRQLKEGEEL